MQQGEQLLDIQKEVVHFLPCSLFAAHSYRNEPFFNLLVDLSVVACAFH
jgi:hypothetical protein